jgi:hypothetical protein
MRLRGGLLVTVSIIIVKSYAAGDLTISGGRSAAMGYASVSTADEWSCFNNQAGLSWCRKISTGVYIDNRSLVKEMSLKSLGMIVPIKKGSFALSFSHFGYSLYNEIKTGLAFSMPFGKKFSAGLQMDYLRIHLGADYGSRNLLTFEMGLQFRMTEKISLGIHVNNPVPVKISQSGKDVLPVCIRMGFSWQLTGSFLGSFEIEKELVMNPAFKAGFEYHFVKPLFIRFGFLTDPAQFTFGIGLELGKFRFDLASSYQPVLGYSPQASLVYIFN